MKHKISAEKLEDFVRKNHEQSYAWIAERTGKSQESVRKLFRKLNLPHKRVTSQNRDVIENPRNEKTGIETRHDGNLIVNWDTKTIVAFLGEFGSVVHSFARHAAIQRAYSNDYEGSGDTQAEIAMKFDFPHAKAVAVYMKLFGVTKSSPGQTDIEFELGLTAEEATAENIQAVKRRSVKLTERAKWAKVQSDADKWNKFDHTTLEPIMEYIAEYVPTYKVVPLKLPKTSFKHVDVVGVSDWHYGKLCYNSKGQVVYNRKIAIKTLHEANRNMMAKVAAFGAPEKWVIPIGTDNMHVDGINHTTTSGTPQARQTEGDWEIDIKNYVDVVMQMIDAYAQVAPVELIVLPGNHDYQTSRMLGVLLEVTYSKSTRVKVIHRPAAPRIYTQHGSNVLVFAHGEDASLAKWDREIFKLFLAEAKEQGVSLDKSKNIYFYHGHVHTFEMKDLGGIQRISLPSLSGEDSWHKKNLYVGNRQQALIDCLNPDSGRVATFFS